MPEHKLKVGDVVARKTDLLTGVIRSFDLDAGTFGIGWFDRTSGSGWRPSDLRLVRTAADETKRRARRTVVEAARQFAATCARVREAAGLPDWHSDEISVEIARVMSCADVAAYRAVSREGANTPLGAKQKVAIWNAIRG